MENFKILKTLGTGSFSEVFKVLRISDNKEYAMKNQVSIMLQRDGFEKSLKIVNETILEKQYSSTQTYWKVFKEELINQNKDE